MPDKQALREAWSEIGTAHDWLKFQGARWLAAEGSGDHLLLEGYLFALTLNRLRRAAGHALKVSGSHLIQRALDEFDRAVPNVGDIRDLLEHFDAYLRGEGNLQKSGQVPRGGATVMWGSTSADTTFIEIDFVGRYHTGVALPASAALAEATLTALHQMFSSM